LSKATYYLLRAHADFNNIVGLCRKYFGSVPGSDKQDFTTTAFSTQSLRLHGFHRKRGFSQATWVQFMSTAFGAAIGPSGGSVDDAIVVAEYGNRVWVLTFGALHGVSFHVPIERRFGVVAVANASTPVEVRQIAAHSHGASSMFRLERRGKSGELTEFLVSRLARRASKIASKVVSSVDRPMIIEGGLGVYFTAPTSIDDLCIHLDKLLTWWNQGNHVHDALRQLDKVRDAEDEALIAARDQELHQMIMNSSDMIGVWSDNETFYSIHPLSVDRSPISFHPRNIEFPPPGLFVASS
jgi:uncharacterized protein (TIGR04141 family)